MVLYGWWSIRSGYQGCHIWPMHCAYPVCGENAVVFCRQARHGARGHGGRAGVAKWETGLNAGHATASNKLSLT